MKKGKKKTITYLLLVSLALVVMLQGLLPFSVIITSKVKETMAGNAVDIDSNLVENRRVVLENAMVDQWSAVRHEAGYLDNVLDALLEERGADMEKMLSDKEMQREYVDRVFPELLSYLRNDRSGGLFLIMANDADVSREADYVGFFLRDSDPNTKAETNSDLLFERGHKSLTRSTGIALDSSWSTEFHFLGNGVRSADDFFYKPYIQAVNNTYADMNDLGFWATPFILEDHYQDNHQMITYSVPLIYNGVIYGILGTEVPVNHVSGYLPVRDLSKDLNAGYAIAINKGNGTYQSITGKGTLYDAIRRNDESFTLTETEYPSLFLVNGASVGTQKIYTVSSKIKMYGGKVPYEDSDWILFGFVTEDSLFGLGNNLYKKIISAILICAILGMIAMFFTVHYITAPVYRLMDSIRNGMQGLKSFKESGISEIDELHEVVENLTESEISVENQLLEEKERYRIALESSNDIFFTYRRNERVIEIVNSRFHNGVWPIDEFFEKAAIPLMNVRDRNALLRMIEEGKIEPNTQIHLSIPGQPEGMWTEMNGKTIIDSQTGNLTIVGYVRDIHSAKMRELEQERHAKHDPVTGFYNLKQGKIILSDIREKEPEGALILLDIYDFDSIVQGYGLTFGDVILNELGELVENRFKERFDNSQLMIRAGADEFMIWVPGIKSDECTEMLAELNNEFASLVKLNVLNLKFHAGIVDATDESMATLINRAQVAVTEAAKRNTEVVIWNESTADSSEHKQFGSIMSQGDVCHMGLASLILNLFDRSTSTRAALDLAVARMRRKFTLEDLLVTDFNGEYLSGVVEYCWRFTETPKGVEAVYHSSEAEYEKMKQLALEHKLLPMREVFEAGSIFSKEYFYGNGVVFPMSDNGQYTGSIFFVGIDPELLNDNDSYDLLWEIGTIIQNRIIQEHHDQSAQAKSDFLARMSHEIRTPMNGIIGMTEIALQENQTEQSRLECLKKVRTSSEYLLGLLNDILDMSKIESGKMTLMKETFDLGKLTSELHSVLDGQFADKGQTFRSEIDLTNRWFTGDSLRISQVLINLLGNAAKYSDRGAETVLAVKETVIDGKRSSIYFGVKDQGTGISEKDRQKIFGLFEQLDNAAHRQGSGLGLAICNRLIHMMDSEILLDSEIGKGSTFYFTLELPIAEAPADAYEDTMEADLTGVRVLVAEDNELNMEIIRTFIEDMGCIMESAFNGQEALDKFSSSEPGYYDIIIMDVMMPVMDGLEAAHSIRTCGHPDSERIPIVAASANAFDEDIRRSLASGMNAHISKPIQVQKLRDTIQKYTGR
ncbi:MAG: response regulator [Eubacteriales bacterium]|nr:response regulator [Eubacteriales bacterium]